MVRAPGNLRYQRAGGLMSTARTSANPSWIRLPTKAPPMNPPAPATTTGALRSRVVNAGIRNGRSSLLAMPQLLD